MAFTFCGKPNKLVLQLAVLAAAAAAAATAPAAAQYHCPRKITVQNLCGHDLALTLTPVANSAHLFGPGFMLGNGKHVEFPVCGAWTGSLAAPGAPAAEFHLGGADGGAWYRVTTAQQSGGVRVSVTPHGSPLQGHCPAAGCAEHACFQHDVPGGNCHGVDEMKIIFYRGY